MKVEKKRRFTPLSSTDSTEKCPYNKLLDHRVIKFELSLINSLFLRMVFEIHVCTYLQNHRVFNE